MPPPTPENPEACAHSLPGRLGEAKLLPASPGSPAWLHGQSPGEGRRANDSLSRQLVTSPRHMILCRTGATCCCSGLVRCCFSPTLIDPKVIPRNTFHRYKATCWEYGIHRIHFTEISLYRYCRVEPWKALTLKDPLPRPPRGECRVVSGLGVRRGAQSTSITHALQDPRKHFPLWAQQNTRGLQRPVCPGVLTKGWVREGCWKCRFFGSSSL